MPVYDAALADGYKFRLNIVQSSQNIGANTSVISWSVQLVKGAGSGKSAGGPHYWSVLIDGQYRDGSIGSYDFTQYSLLTLGQGNMTIAHNSDGTKVVAGQAGYDDNNTYGELGDAQIGPGNLIILTTIPRASQPSTNLSAVDAGDPITINTNRASTSFTHTIKYTFGSASGTIATGVGASTTWTPPLSLLNQIPNSTSATCTITCDTYSGGTKIGTKTDTFTLRAGSDIVPSFTAVTASEANSAVTAAAIGGYVQSVSKIAAAITGAAGVYSSAIVSYRLTMDGQTITSVSGTFPNPLPASGTRTITGVITDSRGRTATKTLSVTVLPYATPNIVSITAKRATAAGVLDPDGTYIRVDLNATVSPLTVGGVPKNTLSLQVNSRLKNTTTWTTKYGPTLQSGQAFNAYVLVSSYSITSSFDVQTLVIDKFNTTTNVSNVATAAIFMDWNTGLGVGKFWEQGMLDVNGDAYISGKLRLPSTADLSLSSTTHPFQIGPDAGGNLALDSNEIQGRSNGAAAQIYINTEGGNVSVGDSTSTLTVAGLFNNTYLPIRMAAGRASVTPSAANTNTSVSVSLPASRFTQTPVITLGNVTGTSTTSLDYQYWLSGSTTSGFTINVRRGNTTTCQFEWMAIQMSNSAATG